MTEGNSLVVLVVEDEVLIRMMAAEMLLDAGFKVFEAADALEALELLNARSDVRAVVTDIEMPGTMNGLALASTVQEQWPRIAVLVTSGRLVPDRTELAPPAAFIPKPYKAADLVSCVEETVAAFERRGD